GDTRGRMGEGGAAFARRTAVVRDGRRPDRWRGEHDETWSAPLLPQGGIVTTVGVRAMIATLGVPEQRLRSVSTVFAAPVRAGAVEIDVIVLRRGRSLSQVLATVRNPGETAGHTSVA